LPILFLRFEMKTRLDVALVERGLAPSRAKAQQLVADGGVTINGAVASKPSVSVDPKDALQVLVGSAALRFVSRGGLKLQAALDLFALDVRGKTCLDVGASTGGFCDCLLQNGAARVVAVENGVGQLHPRLLVDERVESRERADVRALKPEDFSEKFGVVVADVSFLSLRFVLPVLPPLLEPNALVIALVKPQFEVGPAHVSRNGLVRDDAHRQRALEQVLACARALNWAEIGAVECPIAGGDGNREWLAAWRT
jgi:23S rRNA (cytidine1920-2'-O)/16S rRNA (cytidine1409-2'-O)-methyltransferase